NGTVWRPIQSIALLGVLLIGLVGPARAQESVGESDKHLAAALATQDTTRKHLRVLGDAFECAEARLVAYRRSTDERELTDQWYVASQLWADAVLLQAAQRTPIMPEGWDPEDARCHV